MAWFKVNDRRKQIYPRMNFVQDKIQLIERVHSALSCVDWIWRGKSILQSNPGSVDLLDWCILIGVKKMHQT